ncbi:DUF5342 family protein [Pseudalkalibacillus caeni]|uniref:YheE family protein n=1 Tax=Exobacillus caeni TaxID=2574798 RepID=A0A5R9F354_9BACL|nr:DUF5342 family protein [Pseudalkalibacillus caeni]TLS38027.1 hypothetical protein FCL54_05640 [Pseudalkalibacillus caeni]
MFSHFQIKKIGNSPVKPHWEFSFFYQGAFYKGLYSHKGEIEWYESSPAEEIAKKLESQIHEMMLFHVYEK